MFDRNLNSSLLNIKKTACPSLLIVKAYSMFKVTKYDNYTISFT